MPKTLILIAVSLVGGCSSCEESLSDEDCPERVALFVDRMAEVAEGSVSLGPMEVEQLPELDAGEVISRHEAALDTDGTRFWLDGRALSAERALEDLDVLHRNMGILYPNRDRFVLYIRADRRAPASALLPVVEKMTDLGETYLVVAGPAALSPIPYQGTSQELRSEVLRVRAAPDASERAVIIGEMIDDQISTCIPAATTFASVSVTTADARHALLTERLEDAFRRCDCRGIDIDGIETALALMQDGPGRNHRILPLVADAIDGATDVDSLAAALGSR